MHVEAYWISPNGELLPVSGSHVNEVMKKPSAFGLTKNYLNEVFASHSEDNLAREELAVGLVRHGWIRIRYYTHIDTYMIEVNVLGLVKGYVTQWAIRELSEGGNGCSHVRIEESDNKEPYEYTLEDISEAVLFGIKEDSFNLRPLVLVRSVRELGNNPEMARARSVIR